MAGAWPLDISVILLGAPVGAAASLQWRVAGEAVHADGVFERKAEGEAEGEAEGALPDEAAGNPETETETAHVPDASGEGPPASCHLRLQCSGRISDMRTALAAEEAQLTVTLASGSVFRCTGVSLHRLLDESSVVEQIEAAIEDKEESGNAEETDATELVLACVVERAEWEEGKPLIPPADVGQWNVLALEVKGRVPLPEALATIHAAGAQLTVSAECMGITVPATIAGDEEPTLVFQTTHQYRSAAWCAAMRAGLEANDTLTANFELRVAVAPSADEKKKPNPPEWARVAEKASECVALSGLADLMDLGRCETSLAAASQGEDECVVCVTLRRPLVPQLRPALQIRPAHAKEVAAFPMPSWDAVDELVDRVAASDDPGRTLDECGLEGVFVEMVKEDLRRQPGLLSGEEAVPLSGSSSVPSSTAKIFTNHDLDVGRLAAKVKLKLLQRAHGRLATRDDAKPLPLPAEQADTNSAKSQKVQAEVERCLADVARQGMLSLERGLEGADDVQPLVAAFVALDRLDECVATASTTHEGLDYRLRELRAGGHLAFAATLARRRALMDGAEHQLRLCMDTLGGVQAVCASLTASAPPEKLSVGEFFIAQESFVAYAMLLAQRDELDRAASLLSALLACGSNQLYHAALALVLYLRNHDEADLRAAALHRWCAARGPAFFEVTGSEPRDLRVAFDEACLASEEESADVELLASKQPPPAPVRDSEGDVDAAATAAARADEGNVDGAAALQHLLLRFGLASLSLTVLETFGCALAGDCGSCGARALHLRALRQVAELLAKGEDRQRAREIWRLVTDEVKDQQEEDAVLLTLKGLAHMDLGEAEAAVYPLSKATRLMRAQNCFAPWSRVWWAAARGPPAATLPTPSGTTARFRAALTAHSWGDFSAPFLCPLEIRASWTLGHAYLARGQAKQAGEAFMRCPRQVAAVQVGCALANHRLARPAVALSALRAALKQDPHHADALLLLGVVFLLDGCVQGGRAAVQLAIAREVRGVPGGLLAEAATLLQSRAASGSDSLHADNGVIGRAWVQERPRGVARNAADLERRERSRRLALGGSAVRPVVATALDSASRSLEGRADLAPPVDLFDAVQLMGSAPADAPPALKCLTLAAIVARRAVALRDDAAAHEALSHVLWEVAVNPGVQAELTLELEAGDDEESLQFFLLREEEEARSEGLRERAVMHGILALRQLVKSSAEEGSRLEAQQSDSGGRSPSDEAARLATLLEARAAELGDVGLCEAVAAAANGL